MSSHLNKLLPNIEAGDRRLVSSGVRFVEPAVVIASSALYQAAQVHVYRRGVAKLFPPRLRKRLESSLALIGGALKPWLLGQLVLMLIVGEFSFLAVLLIGPPNSPARGLLAGIAERIQHLGLFFSAIPAGRAVVRHLFGQQPGARGQRRHHHVVEHGRRLWWRHGKR